MRKSASKVKYPTLILHARGDRRVPFDEGLLLAGLVPDARLVSLDTENHILLSHEPAPVAPIPFGPVRLLRAGEQQNAEFLGD